MSSACSGEYLHRSRNRSFMSGNYWLSFFNVPLFFKVFFNAESRDQMQPCLILSGLAVSTFMRSSEIDQGSAGRNRALWLRDAAQSALEASFNAQWIEPTLAQAAWVSRFRGTGYRNNMLTVQINRCQSASCSVRSFRAPQSLHRKGDVCYDNA